MLQTTNFDWAVILCTGLAGMAATAALLYLGVEAKNIEWIDPYFQVGDFCRYWVG